MLFVSHPPITRLREDTSSTGDFAFLLRKPAEISANLDNVARKEQSLHNAVVGKARMNSNKTEQAGIEPASISPLNCASRSANTYELAEEL